MNINIHRDLISICVSVDPSKRPTFKQLINSNFFDLIFLEADEKSIMLCKELWPIVSQVNPLFYFPEFFCVFLLFQNNCALWSEFFPIFCDKFNIECKETTQDTIGIF